MLEMNTRSCSLIPLVIRDVKSLDTGTRQPLQINSVPALQWQPAETLTVVTSPRNKTTSSWLERWSMRSRQTSRYNSLHGTVTGSQYSRRRSSTWSRGSCSRSKTTTKWSTIAARSAGRRCRMSPRGTAASSATKYTPLWYPHTCSPLRLPIFLVRSTCSSHVNLATR